jgi:hypothetical protein
MDKRVTLYERDLLYPTGDNNNPGCVNVKVYSPTKDGFIPIIIENCSTFLIKEYIYSVIKIVQNDIFNRVNINIKSNGAVIIKDCSLEECTFQKVVFHGKEIEFVKIDNLDEFLD